MAKEYKTFSKIELSLRYGATKLVTLFTSVEITDCPPSREAEYVENRNTYFLALQRGRRLSCVYL